MKNFIFKMAIISSSAVTGIIWPTYQFVSQGIRTTATEVKFPFIDENSDAEFIGNLLLESVIAVHGLAGYVGLEVGMDICTNLVSVSQKLLEYRLLILDEQHEKISSTHPQKLFKNVIQQVQIYEWYDLISIRPTHENLLTFLTLFVGLRFR